MDVRDAMPVTAEGAVIYGVIYMITNRVNGKVYIGQTTRPLKERAAQHLKCKKKLPLYSAIAKYGSDKFIMEIIDHAPTKEKLDELEKFHIQEKNARDRAFGYNLMEGGSNGQHCVTSRAKISAALKKNWESLEVRAKMSAALKKSLESPEVRAKISVALKKNWESPEARAKMSAALKKNWESHEVRAKISVALKKSRESHEARAKMSAAAKKSRESPEVRAKISAALKKSLESHEARAKMSATSKKNWESRREKRGPYIIDSFGNLFYSAEEAAKHHSVSVISVKKMLYGERKAPFKNGITFSRVKPKTPPEP